MRKQQSAVLDHSTVGVDAAVERLHLSMLTFQQRLQSSGRRWWQATTELTRSELQVLRTVAEHGECRSKDVAARLEVGPGVVSRQLAALSEHGMVDRRRDPDDGRAELVRPTERGHEVLAEVREVYLAQLKERFGSWEPARLDAAADLIDHLAELLTTPVDRPRAGTAHHHTEDHA